MELKKNIWSVVILVIGLLVMFTIGYMIWSLLSSQSQAKENSIPDDKALNIILCYAVPESENYIEKKIRILKDRSFQEQISAIIDKMVRHPVVRKKYNWWPETLMVRSAYLRESGLLILDFEKHVQYNHTIGVYEELLMIRSIIKTIKENYENIDRIRFLVGGQEMETLAGHVDISRPLKTGDLL